MIISFGTWCTHVTCVETYRVSQLILTRSVWLAVDMCTVLQIIKMPYLKKSGMFTLKTLILLHSIKYTNANRPALTLT